jgi:hypothetical protein
VSKVYDDEGAYEGKNDRKGVYKGKNEEKGAYEGQNEGNFSSQISKKCPRDP